MKQVNCKFVWGCIYREHNCLYVCQDRHTRMHSSNQNNNLSSCMNSQSRTLTKCLALRGKGYTISIMRWTSRLKEDSIQSVSFKHLSRAVNYSPRTDVFRRTIINPDLKCHCNEYEKCCLEYDVIWSANIYQINDITS